DRLGRTQARTRLRQALRASWIPFLDRLKTRSRLHPTAIRSVEQRSRRRLPPRQPLHCRFIADPIAARNPERYSRGRQKNDRNGRHQTYVPGPPCPSRTEHERRRTARIFLAQVRETLRQLFVV